MDFRLLRRIEAYVKRARVPPTRFGREAVRDPQLVFDLRRGRTPRPPLAAKLNAYLDEAERAVESKKCRRR